MDTPNPVSMIEHVTEARGYRKKDFALFRRNVNCPPKRSCVNTTSLHSRATAVPVPLSGAPPVRSGGTAVPVSGELSGSALQAATAVQ